MTVGELIEILKDMPQNAICITTSSDLGQDAYWILGVEEKLVTIPDRRGIYFVAEVDDFNILDAVVFY